MATLDQVVSQLIAADMPPLPPGHPVASGKIVRYGPQKKAWYVLHEYRSIKNSRVYYFGAYGVWRGAESNTVKFERDYGGMEPGEADRLKASMAQQEADEKTKRMARAAAAANRARAQYDKGRADGESPYLKRKGVELEKGLRIAGPPKDVGDALEGTLLVPMVRYDVTDAQLADQGYQGPRKLCGLQKIAPDGSKLFNKGMSKEGCAFQLGREPKDGNILIVAEGVATALTVRQATGRSRIVYVAFDAGNLVHVARILRKLYPNSPILFCADDDAYLEAQLSKRLRGDYGVVFDGEFCRVAEEQKVYVGKDGPLTVMAQWVEDANGVPAITGAVTLGQIGGEVIEQKVQTFALTNAGRIKAYAAAEAVGMGRVCWPVFKARKLHADPDGPKLTDFNDLHKEQGLAAVEQQLTDAIDMALHAEAGLPAPAKKASAKKDKKGGGAPGGAAGGEGGDTDTAHWKRFWNLINRFTLIYPTDTAYDHQLGDIVKVSAMRLKFGELYVDMWLASGKRRDVDLPDVVFDPTGQAKAPKLNLYRGLGIVPAPSGGGCEKMIELLHYLCGESPEDSEAPVTAWVLKWLAYPLQHVGAKMQTAVVMWGKEGAGKNLFFGAIRDIYGTHGGTISQRQLEDKFNAWLSAKLFVIANEVVTRHELRQHVGFLKNLITEPEIWVNRKMRDERAEANHMNLVFFSNEIQALQISPDDRRYMIIKTPVPRPFEFYKAVAAEVRAGGAAALHRYLLDLPLDDFNEHSKPLETEAKRDLIELGMNGAQLFWRDIYEKEIALPYCPAVGEDLYRCFQSWCRRNGEKMPARINRFIPDFMSLNGVRRKPMRVPVMVWERGEISVQNGISKPRRVLLMGDPPEGGDQDEWVKDSVIKFAQAAIKYCGGGDSA